MTTYLPFLSSVLKQKLISSFELDSKILSVFFLRNAVRNQLCIMNNLSKTSFKSSIRLTFIQIQSIKSCIKDVFGENLKIYLFGSRTNPLLKGGDIDLFVYLEYNCTTKLEKILLAKSKIEIKIGEQKIDLIAGTIEDLQNDKFLKDIHLKGILL